MTLANTLTILSKKANSMTQSIQLLKNGVEAWFLNGNPEEPLHKVDGPAVIYPDGSKAYCQNGLLHRVGGPALEYSDGTKAWYLDEIEYSIKDYCQKLYGDDWEKKFVYLSLLY